MSGAIQIVECCPDLKKKRLKKFPVYEVAVEPWSNTVVILYNLENKPRGLLSRGALAWGLIFEGGLYFSGSSVEAYFRGAYIGKFKV